MAKFKAGDAVKLRDDVSINANVPYNTRFVVHEIDELRRCYLDCGYWIFEDALEAWPESTEETMSNEIDPQLLEIFKVIIGGFAANPALCYDHEGRICLQIGNAIEFSKESVRLLRKEKL